MRPFGLFLILRSLDLSDNQCPWDGWDHRNTKNIQYRTTSTTTRFYLLYYTQAKTQTLCKISTKRYQFRLQCLLWDRFSSPSSGSPLPSAATLQIGIRRMSTTHDGRHMPNSTMDKPWACIRPPHLRKRGDATNCEAGDFCSAWALCTIPSERRPLSPSREKTPRRQLC